MIACVHCHHETAPDALDPTQMHPLRCPACNAVFPHSVLRHLPMEKIDQYIDNVGAFPMRLANLSRIIHTKHWSDSCCDWVTNALGVCLTIGIALLIASAPVQSQEKT